VRYVLDECKITSEDIVHINYWNKSDVPMIIACSQGYVDKVKLLFTKFDFSSYKSNWTFDDSFILASRVGYIDILEILNSYEMVDLTCMKKALTEAAAVYEYYVVRYLLDKVDEHGPYGPYSSALL